MDLLERYLQAIGKYLPDETRQDTLAELRANLLESMDAHTEELGRPLTEAETAAILKAHGKPEVVALRYLPQRSLIGPTIFPFYEMTLKRVLPLVIFVSLLARGIEFVTVHRESLAHALAGFALGLASSLLISAAIITAIFAIIERTVARDTLRKKWNEWDPAKLPAVKRQETDAPGQKSFAGHAVDLVVHCLWMAYVLWVPWHPFWLLGPGMFYLGSLHVALAPVWHTFYALLIVLLVVQLAMRLLAFVPQAQGFLPPLKIATDLLGLVAIGMLAASSNFFIGTGGNVDAHTLASVNQGIGVAVRIAFVFALIGIVQQVWKYAKRVRPARQMAF